MKTAEEHYKTDPAFHALTNYMFKLLMDKKLSVYELRDAVTLAANMFYMENPDPSYFAFYQEDFKGKWYNKDDIS